MQPAANLNSWLTNGTSPHTPEAHKQPSWLGRAISVVTDVSCEIGRAVVFAVKSLSNFVIWAIATPCKYIFNGLKSAFTSTKTTAPEQSKTGSTKGISAGVNASRQYLPHAQRPSHKAQNLPKHIEDLEYRIVTDQQTIQEKLQKELRAAENQLNNCPKAFQGNPNAAAAWYQQAPGIPLRPDQTQAVVTRTHPYAKRTTMHYEAIPGTQTGIAYAQGARDQMEDAHIASRFTVMINNKPVDIDITGIFDGHGGSAWSQYASQNIVRHLKRRIEEWNPNGLHDAGIWNALKLALVDLDNESPLIPAGQSAEDFLHELAKSGTTANIALRINGDLWIVNLGDSRAILIDNNGKFRQVSEDAEPDDPKYKHSIEKRGGEVLDVRGVPRVNAHLAVARSLGDHYLNGAISARAKVTKIPAHESAGGKLIQICDGISETAFSEDIACTVNRQLNQGNPVHVAAARPLAKAYQAGSMDNMSVMVSVLPTLTATGYPMVNSGNLLTASSAVNSTNGSPVQIANPALPPSSQNPTNLNRFLDEQNRIDNSTNKPRFEQALNELQLGQKNSHWSWYIFPQVAGLAPNPSENSRKFEIKSLQEAQQYWSHPTLRGRLLNCCNAVNQNKQSGRPIEDILGGQIDALKLHACATLFSRVSGGNPVFQQILQNFYQGQEHQQTLNILSNWRSQQSNWPHG